MEYNRFNVDDGSTRKDSSFNLRHLFENVSGQRIMGLFGQFLQLLWKNVILRKRQKVRISIFTSFHENGDRRIFFLHEEVVQTVEGFLVTTNPSYHQVYSVDIY